MSAINTTGTSTTLTVRLKTKSVADDDAQLLAKAYAIASASAPWVQFAGVSNDSPVLVMETDEVLRATASAADRLTVIVTYSYEIDC